MPAPSTKQEQTFLTNSNFDKWIKMDNYDNCELKLIIYRPF